ncbi:MAG TPA: ATP-binding protein [Candidatus Dormibacteraeota bacterium]
MSAEAPSVTLDLDSKPETLTLVRGMLAGVGELLAIDPELLDDLKTAVSEACNNVVLHAYPDALGPLTVVLSVWDDGIEVIVRDQGCGISDPGRPDDHQHGIGLPVIRALTERSEFRPRPGGGTEVTMMFRARRDGKRLFELPAEPARDEGWDGRLDGDAVVSVSPVVLLSGVLGRLARALAASARFSLDRFSDVYLVTDAIAAHAATAASGKRIAFSIKASERRIEIAAGPFHLGSATELSGDAEAGGPRSPLSLLSDELAVDPIDGAELLRVVMIDHRRWASIIDTVN